MTDRPEPLIAANIDLRGMDFMPLKGDALFKSTTWVKASPEARCAALRLWWHSFAREVPAGSLPDDDILLSDYAGYGGVMRAWRRIKDQAMRGWLLCSDGRWYHKVVCDLAVEAWKGRVRNREKQRKFRERQTGVVTVTLPAETIAVPGNVTVTEGVTKPFRNARESEGELKKEEERKEVAPDAAASPASRPDLSAPQADAEPADIRTAIFNQGLRWLMHATGSMEPTCRKFLGMLIGQHGEQKLAAVLMAAQREKPVDPRAWMVKNIARNEVVNGAQRGHKTKPNSPIVNFLAAFRDLGDRGPEGRERRPEPEFVGSASLADPPGKT